MICLCYVGTETIPTITGPDVPLVVGKQHQFICSVEHIWLNDVKFSWTVNNRSVQALSEEYHKFENNTATFMSILIYNVTEMDTILELICSVALPAWDGERASLSSIVYGTKIKEWKTD